jgi:hypothetical protein
MLCVRVYFVIISVLMRSGPAPVKMIKCELCTAHIAARVNYNFVFGVAWLVPMAQF